MEKESTYILVVEDDETIFKTFKEILESEGYIVDVAQTGDEAIKKSRSWLYHLVLLDIKLPDIEGTELLTQLHRDTPQMRKIMVTGYPSQENAVQSLNLGANAYLTKPIAPSELLKVVEEQLKEYRDTENFSEEKVKEWIGSRGRKLVRDIKRSESQ